MAGTWTLCILFLCILGLFASTTSAEDNPCTVWAGDKFYDLTALKSDKDYVVLSPEGRHYYINVCQATKTDLWNPKVDDEGSIAGFTRRDHGDVALGRVNTTLTVRDGDPTMTLTNGSPCPTQDQMHAATVIRFRCDTSVTDNGEPMLIAQLPPPADDSCFFTFEWRTHVACSTQPKGSWGVLTVLATIAGILLLAYIVIGSFYNYSVLGLRGLDILPRYSLFSLQDTINFCKICMERIKSRSSDNMHFGNGGMGGWRRPGNGGYRGLDEEQTGMLSGPPGFLDEEEDEEPEHPAENERHAGMDSNGVIRL